MTPGNATCLHTWINDFAEYSAFNLELNNESVTIHHSQFAKYPVLRAARTVYNGLTFTPLAYDTYDAFRDAYFDRVHDDIRTAIEETNGVTVGLHDEQHFDNGTYVKPMQLSDAATRLIELYDGFSPDDPDVDPYERYGEQRDLPATKAELVADLFTLYNIRLAEAHITPLRNPPHDADWTEDEADIALYAMRDLIEKEHGWSVFTAPSPSRETIEKLWTMQEEVGFPRALKWVYTLFLVPHGPKFYSPNDAFDTSVRASLAATMREDLTGVPEEYRYAAESTSLDELEIHREQMRESGAPSADSDS